jgi:carbohydrate binding protein with CBM30 domain
MSRSQSLERQRSGPARHDPAQRWAAQAVLLLGLVLPACAFSAEPPSGDLVIWNFERGITNDWGGRYNVYTREPSWARTYLDSSVRRSAGSYSLRVTVHREREGFCGLWLKFYREADATRRFLDATPYRFLSFWMKGEKGGEDFDFDLTDEAHQDKEDPALTRHLHAYLPKGVTTQWQEVQIPLADFHGLDLSRLAQLTLKFTARGDYRFYIEDLTLKHGESAPVPTAEKLAVPAPADPFEQAHGRMWVWKTRQLFEGPRPSDEIEKFFAFCATTRIRELYLSLDFGEVAGPIPLPYQLRDPERYGEFLERAHRLSLTVDALAGTPEWAARENHPLALAAVDAVLAFNRSAPSAAHFDGVHFDVEPYLLVEYADPEDRREILGDYLQMVSECIERLRADPRMHFSCDVPAWFYAVDPNVRQELTVTFRGVAKTVGEHLTDMLDTVTIMDYRNEADGANGIIAFGTAALEYAASRGREIIVGLETSLAPDSAYVFVCGLPPDEFRRRLAQSGLRHRRYFEGFKMAAFRDGKYVHVGLEEPAQLTGPTRAAFEKALSSVAQQVGAASDPERYPTRPILEAAREALRQDPEWKGFDRLELADPETRQKIAGFRAVYRTPRKITFDGLGREVFTEEASSTLEWLGRYPSFAGLAFHFYDSFRSLMEAHSSGY